MNKIIKFSTGIAVIGCGYWGKNHVRVFSELGVLKAVCDFDSETARNFSAKYDVMDLSFKEILENPDVLAVVIATPAEQHYSIARDAIMAGKHVLVEKPLALRSEEADELVALAAENGTVLMVGHLLHYHSAFLKLADMVHSGELGSVHYLYSNRLNLGKFRREESILWSFAPHDISMLLGLMGEMPVSVYATGAGFLQKTVADVTTTHLSFPGGQQASIFVSWLHPYKDQRLVVVGDQGMAVFDDTKDWSDKLVVYHEPVQWQADMPTPNPKEAKAVPIEPTEPLMEEALHFLQCIASGSTPKTDGREGAGVLRVLEAAEKSMHSGNTLRFDNESEAEFRTVGGGRVHNTARVDEPSDIGDNTTVWHFSHVLRRTKIGQGCVLGQNVMIGPDVDVGDNCKIQNNVSIYKGVTLEDGVFCGPSCVFTNVINPRSEVERKDEFRPTLVQRGATIGANATIVCGSTIGAYSLIGAGAVVTSNVPPHALMVGSPARQTGWVSHDGEKLGDDLVCPRSKRQYYVDDDGTLAEIGDRSDRPLVFVDLQAQQQGIRTQIDNRIGAVLDHGKYIMGPEVAELEESLAAFCGAPEVISCASGTDAILMALMAIGVQAGEGVIVPSFTFIATAEAVALIGAIPIFVDALPNTFNIDPKSMERGLDTAKNLGIKPRAVIPVDLFGQPADYDEIHAIAENNGLVVIADAAQSFGAELDGVKVGKLAPITTTSFFPAKPLGCYGDGGAVFVNDPDIATILRSIRVHGKGTGKYDNVRIGLNGRLDTLQAAVLLEKISIFQGELEKRQVVAERYNALLPDHVTPPVIRDGARSAWAQYTILSKNRDRLAKALGEAGIPTAIYYPKPMHMQEAYREFPKAGNQLAVSEQLAEQVLGLPMHPYLTAKDQEKICSVIAGL